jgi:hypothetical protein
VLQNLEVQVAELLSQRVLEIRERAHEIKRSDPSMEKALAHAWNEGACSEWL